VHLNRWSASGFRQEIAGSLPYSEPMFCTSEAQHSLAVENLLRFLGSQKKREYELTGRLRATQKLSTIQALLSPGVGISKIPCRPSGD